MTGPNTQYGDQIQAGALTAIETINAKGGVKGKKLEPILIDDGCEPKQPCRPPTAWSTPVPSSPWRMRARA